MKEGKERNKNFKVVIATVFNSINKIYASNELNDRKSQEKIETI
jgi:hypothetical protein